MKQVVVSSLFTAFLYFLFASANHSWNSMMWSGKSITWFDILTVLGWVFIFSWFFLIKLSEEK